MRNILIVRLMLFALLLSGLSACGRTTSSDVTTSLTPESAASAAATSDPPEPVSPTALSATDNPYPEPPTPLPVTPVPPQPRPTSLANIPEWLLSSIEISPTLRVISAALFSQPSSGTFISVDAIEVMDHQAVVISSRHSNPEPSLLHVVDLSEPDRPRVRGSLTIPGARHLGLAGQIAWVTTEQGLQAVDLSDLDRPVARGSITTLGFTSSVLVRGQRGYATIYGTAPGQHGSLAILDLSNPDEPHLLGRLSLGGGLPEKLELVGDLAYVAVRDVGIEIVDVSHPEAPVVRGGYPLKTCYALTVKDNRVYVTGWLGFDILDVSDPTAPRLISSHPVRHFSDFSDIQVVGERVYLTEANYGSSEIGFLFVLDIHDPRQAVVVGRVTLDAYANAVRIVGSQIAVAYGRHGLVLFEEQPR